MAFRRKQLFDLIRPNLKAPPGMTVELVKAIDALLDQAGVPRDDATPSPPAPAPAAAPAPPAAPAQPAPAPAAPVQPAPAPAAPSPPAAPAGRLDIAGLRQRLGLPGAGGFDAAARQALFDRLSNLAAPPLTDADFTQAAASLGVAVGIIRAVRKVEAPRGAFDELGRPSILYERHVFARNTAPKNRFNTSNPLLCGPPFGPGGYGKFSAQYGKLADACALDPEAAFRACSWGAFQILGENAVGIGYASAIDMALALTVSEAAHLESFIRFVRSKGLLDELRACRPGNPASCIPFVRGYNGLGFAAFEYHKKLAQAAL